MNKIKAIDKSKNLRMTQQNRYCDIPGEIHTRYVDYI
ncbi:hypothetical protein J2Z80_002677 [Thermoanaerobacterium butyriciformans]|uniref:Uncharacterized protein n=1 Tax=Thermoanaerobacterium butyriciformans TaxID=1702242 RepID=A0ABS4NHI4_9THEO|nr:hypothetical protein [Thermoanaerobacterium butyriciformans]